MGNRPQAPPLKTDRSGDDGFVPQCPQCKGAVCRVQRRFLDRMINVFFPIRRYRCLSADCLWVGDLLVKRPPLSAGQENNDASPILDNIFYGEGPVLTGNLTSILLIENNPIDAEVIQNALSVIKNGQFLIGWVSSLPKALKRLEKGDIQVVLLDLSISEGEGLKAFDLVSKASGNALILVIGSIGEEAIANQALAHGAMDYFLKSHIDAHWLPRALRWVIDLREMQNDLLKSEARFRAMSDGSPLGIFVTDASEKGTYSNEAYRRISGLGEEEAIGALWSVGIHPEDLPEVLSEWQEERKNQDTFQSEPRFLRKDGSVVWTRMNISPFFSGKTLNGYVQIVEDITDRKSEEMLFHEMEGSLFEEKERAQITLNSIGDGVLTSGAQGEVTYMNVVAEKLTGWSLEDASGKPLEDVFRIIEGKTGKELGNPILKAVLENRTIGLGNDCILVRKDGVELAIEDSTSPIHNRDGSVSGGVIVFHDITEAKALSLKTSHQSLHDFLTDLPNRSLLSERAAQVMEMANRHQKQFAILFLDLDHFKHINDSLGHQIGDLLLVAVAKRLVSCVRQTDTVCRQGGDEFVILLSEIRRLEDASNISEKLLCAFGAPFIIENQELHITLSIGISLYPDDAGEVETVIQNADTAMYQAKTNGRNNYQFFRAEMNVRAVHHLGVENSLRRALKSQEFFLHYQPKIDLASGKMTGAEALVRWNDPHLGLVYPGSFISIAEESGLIIPIGQWVLRECCEQIQSWLLSGLPAVPVAINISPIEFRQKNFLGGVLEVLKETGLPPSYLELELTEGILMTYGESSNCVIETLNHHGVHLAIDDFGTGYSSLSYLKRFHIDTLKIDQSFVRDISTDSDSATIVSAVIGLGRNLKQKVVAEGVETMAQVDFLQQQKCHEGQGFYFSYPLSADDFKSYLLSGNVMPALMKME